MTYDVHAVRECFPALAHGVAHFDGPGGTQVPSAVGRAVADTLTAPICVRGAMTAAQRRAEHEVQACRAALADLLATPADGVVFGRSMTQLTYDLSRTLADTWQPGDEVVVTRLDHDANIRPWVQAAQRVGAVVRWADFDPLTGELEVDHVREVLSERTRLVAFTGSSNLIGTRPDVAAITAAVHAVGALAYVDGVHQCAHETIDVPALGADFYACSPYKFLGPHCGVLAAGPDLLETLHPDKLAPSTDAVPERFELGTLPYELMAGVTAAVDFLAALAPVGAGDRRADLLSSLAAVEAHEETLRGRVEAGLADLADRFGVQVHSRAARRSPTLLLTFAHQDAESVSAALAARNINAPAGSFYALEASRHLGLGDGGGLRVGLAPYTTADEVDRLLTALADVLAVRTT